MILSDERSTRFALAGIRRIPQELLRLVLVNHPVYFDAGKPDDFSCTYCIY